MREEFLYRYEFATGETKEFSISNMNGMSEEDIRKWIPLLREMDRMEYNNDKREKRRHCSLNALDRDDNLISSRMDGFEGLRVLELWNTICATLTTQETVIARMYFLQGLTTKEVAAVLHFSTRRVQQIIRDIRKKMKKIAKSFRF